MTQFRPSRLLPVLTGHGGRSAMTCQYRCGNACSHPAPNTSGNPYFGDIASEVSRRGLLRAGALGALVVGVGSATGALRADAAHAAPAAAEATSAAAPAGTGALTFKPVPPNTLDAVIVPNGYDHSVLLAWGDEVVAGAPEWRADRQSAAAQAKQFGFNNDWLITLPLDRQGRRALLVVNHEYTNENLMFPGFTSLDALTVEQIQVAMAAHGLSVVEIERVGDSGEWKPVTKGSRRLNRRITALTAMRFTGPAAGSPLLRTAADPQGLTVRGSLNNCAGGLTPWGTVLSGEENFNQYFVGGDGVPAEAKPALARYGIDTVNRYPSGSRKWERADERFDLARNPNEANRFGWVLELDPYDPNSIPRKHTAMGRVKHEGAEIILAKDGRVVAYMGDDERFDYLYKFVSDKKMRQGDSPADRRHNMTLLESGTLYVAQFGATSASEIDGSGKLPADGAFNGTGRWIPLARGTQSLVPGMTIDQVLVHTRLAADKVGATKMDRPEDVAPNPRTGKVYAALTNNTRRGAAGQPAADEVNPRTNNKHGHVLEITEDGGDNAAETFTWDIPIVCGDPADPNTFFAGYDKTKVSPISCPDNLDFDAHGNLWISTDGNALGSNDGLFAVPVDGPERGHVKQFLTVPTGAEQASAHIAPDNRTAFVSVQHPGEIDGASLDKPASTWPYGDFARPAVITVWGLDGRQIGA
ncbi:PhoX family protein [Micromonospora aurantiaca (nom. illeg.)]|uniref:PhoX family protein n=1 Tax=Micromonospora aurantiaca (nom. illeg.) TaxID=47850 RepID=UPI0016571BFC|nr:PhoX family phosphatase [Micromonospora aurantiaca]MBC9001739.1 PhoX family phosphatase [Micromonospora aurantiaca]